VIVVDTSALLAILNKEPERDRFLDVLANDDRVMVSAVTLYEAMLVAATRRGPDTLSDLAQMLETVQPRSCLLMPIRLAPPRPSTCGTAKACIQRRGSICAMRRVRPGETPQRSPALQGR